MENSILNPITDPTTDKTNKIVNAMSELKMTHSPLNKVNTGYDRQLQKTPIDDYEAMYLIDKDTPEEMAKPKNYLRDAWNTFLNNRDEINIMSERAKLVKDINPEIEKLDTELNYLNQKIQLESSTNGVIDPLDQERIEELSSKKEELLQKKSDTTAEIEGIHSELNERKENYKPSARYQINEQRAQDAPWYSPEYMKYVVPGLAGSSAATVEPYIVDAITTGALYLGRHYATTGVLNAIPGLGAITNLIGWGGAALAVGASIAGNLYSRHRESLAQVYGAYRSKVEKDLQNRGIDINDYANLGREQLLKNNPNVDVSKISNEEIINRVVSGEIDIEDNSLNDIKGSARSGLDQVYDKNMTLSAIDVAQSALMFAPIGKAMGKVITKPIRAIGKPLEKVVEKVAEPIATKYNKLIDDYIGYNARLAYNRPNLAAAKTLAKGAGKLATVGVSEAFEEGNQDVFDYDYIKGNYDQESSGILSSIMSLADANYRTAKIISGIDTTSELANDPQFWNDIKGGFALGIFMGAAPTGISAVSKSYKDLAANGYVHDLVADQISKKDAMIKASAYTSIAGKKLDYQDNVLATLEAYKHNLPEGITKEDVDKEIATAKDIFSLAKSSTNNKIAKEAGFNKTSAEYNTLVGLQHMSQLNLNEAISNSLQAAEADDKIYTDLQSNPILGRFNEQDKSIAIQVSRLNVQKQSLQELEKAITSESNKQKFGIANANNSTASQILKSIPQAISKIDAELDNLTEGTTFGKNYIESPSILEEGSKTYLNSFISNIDMLMANNEMDELFGNYSKDGKKHNFNSADVETKKKIANKIKAKVTDYLNKSDKTDEIVNENAKQIVEPEVITPKPVVTKQEDPDTRKIDLEIPEIEVPTSVATKETPAKKPKVVTEEMEDEYDEPTSGKGTSTKSLEEISKQFEADKKELITPKEEKPTKEQPSTPVVSFDTDEEAEDEMATQDDLRNFHNDLQSNSDNRPAPQLSNLEKQKIVDQKLAAGKQAAKTDNLTSEERQTLKDDWLSLEDELLEELGDKVSHTLFFQPYSDKPMIPGAKTGKELAKQIESPTFFSECTTEFMIDESFVEQDSPKYKKGDVTTYDGATILVLHKHPTGLYVTALKTPVGARKHLSRLNNSPELSTERLATINDDIEIAINNLRIFRNYIIRSLESKSDNEMVIPVSITRTNGEYNVRRNGDRAMFRPIYEVKGFGISSDPYDITPENVEFGIGKGIVDNMLITGKNGNILPGKGGSGQVFIYPPKSNVPSGNKKNIQVNPARFTRTEAEYVLDLILQYADNNTATAGNTSIPVSEVINFMVRFGDATKIETNDPRFNWLKAKQFFIDERGNLVVGTNTYKRDVLTQDVKNEIIDHILTMHWNVEKNTFFSTLKTALPTVHEAIMSEKYPEFWLAPGVVLNKQSFIDSKSGREMYTMGFLISRNKFSSDLNDNLFKNSFAYAHEVAVVKKSDVNEKAIEESAAKAETITTAVSNNVTNAPFDTETKPTDSIDEDYEKAKETVTRLSNNGEIDILGLDSEEEDLPLRKVSGAYSKEVTQEEINWFKNALGLPEDNLQIVDDAIALGNDTFAMGLVKENSTTLWKAAEAGTLYHEAYHRVSLLILTPRERNKIYEAYRNRTGYIASNKEIEEDLAEGFRQYMLNRVEPDLNILKRAWKQIKHFISKWVFRSDTNIQNIYDRISTKYYSKSKNNSESVAAFIKSYKGAGAPFTIGGHKFKYITNTQFKEVTNSLLAALFKLNNVKFRNDLENLNFSVLRAALDPELEANKKAVEAGKITPEQAEVRREIFENFDDVFKDALRKKLNEYQIKAIEKEEEIQKEIEDKASGDAVGDQMSKYIKESLEISAKDNAAAAIKIFIATLPKREYFNDPVTGALKSRAVASNLTGFPLMIDFDRSWNTIINELCSKNSFADMLSECAKLRKVYPIFDALYLELYKNSKLSGTETESQIIAKENLATQFRNTFRKAKHKIVGLLSETLEDSDGKSYTNLYVKSENANNIANNIIEGWNYNLIRNSKIVTFAENEVYYANKDADNLSIVSKLIDLNGKLLQSINKYRNNPEKKLANGKTYKQYFDEELINIKNRVLDRLSFAGVDIDMDTLNSFIVKEYYDVDPVEAFANFITDNSEDGYSFFFNTKLKALSDIEPGGNVKNKYNKHITKYYNDSKFLKRLAESYGMMHPSAEELSILSTDGKLLYPISDHNYLTDMVQLLDSDLTEVEKMTKVMYNTGSNPTPGIFKGSSVLTRLYNNPTKGKIGFETLAYFKDLNNSNDSGRKYTQVSPLEDYIAKMTFTQTGRIVLPTMGDSQTYNTLYGSAIRNFKSPLDLSSGSPKFDIQILNRFCNYFETELDTIEFNYANESAIGENDRIKNYDTGARNGYKLRYFNGLFKVSSRGTIGGYEIASNKTDINEALRLAEELDKEEGIKDNRSAKAVMAEVRNTWNSLSEKEKADLINNYLWDAFQYELDYVKELGIIEWDGSKLTSIKNLALPTKVLETTKSSYEKRGDKFSKHAHSLAVTELLSNHFVNTMYSVIEFEKLFVKDPAYYKDPVDKIKRLREVLSTGVTPRIDYDEGNPMANLTEVNVGTLHDNVIVSRQLDKIHDYARRSATVKMLQEIKGLSYEESIDAYDANDVSEDIKDAVEALIDDKFSGYGKKDKPSVNQTDATVMISPDFYKELVRRVDGWTPEVAKAFDLLNDPTIDITNVSDETRDKYFEALAVTLKPLKFMSFGDHYNETLKRNVPIFNKMAMFPVHRIFSTGDIGGVLEVMQSRNIHMLAFDSAVKVGQHDAELKVGVYTDSSNTKVDVEGMMKMPVHKQSLANFRRQLVTDPHHADRQMFVTQAQKAAMGNIRSEWTYHLPTMDREIKGSSMPMVFKHAHDMITEYGRRSLEKEFGVTAENIEANAARVANILRKKAESSNMNDNVLHGLGMNGDITNSPISGMSDNAWLESALISMFNKDTIDTRLPGGMFIQMSSVMYNNLTVRSGKSRSLNFINDDGSMDCVISINLLKHIIPDYENKTFAEAKKWLNDRKVIGSGAKALAMGYRIPAQGQSSTAALRVIDVYPEQIGDTITLPDEFTALTGSDFDIDKLFVARYNFDQNGNKVRFETKEQYEQRLRNKGFDDEFIARKTYDKFDGKTDYEANSKEANENLLLDIYLSVISHPLNFSETRQPLDTVSGYVKDIILSDIDNRTGARKKRGTSQLYYSTPGFQSRTKSELNGGKDGIAPFALANAHHVLTQLVKLDFMNNEVLSAYDIFSLSNIKSNDNTGINILDWLSALINAHVDVAKDPYIIRLNVRKLTFNMTNLLIRSGKGENTFYFLSQKALRDYATEYDKYSGSYGVDSEDSIRANYIAYKNVYERYKAIAKSLAKEKSHYEKLAHLDIDGLPDSRRKSIFSLDTLKKDLTEERTFDWYFSQLEYMNAYKDLEPFAKSLSELTKLSQIDTKKFGNNFGLQSSFLDKWIQYMTEQKVFEDPVKLFTNTFLYKKIQDGMLFPKKMLRKFMIRLSPAFESKRSLIQFYTNKYAVSDDSYINNLTRMMETSYKSMFFNQYVKDNSINLSNLMYGESSVARKLENIKRDIKTGKYPSLLASDGSMQNVLLDNIFAMPKTDSTEKDSPEFIAYKPNKSADNNFENEVIRSWEELLDSEYPEVNSFAKDLAIYAFYTSGDAFGKNNLFRYVPDGLREEIGYYDYIRRCEEDNTNTVNEISVREVMENLWWNDSVVPTIKYTTWDESQETIEQEGKPVQVYEEHEFSGMTVVDGDGKSYDVPGIIYSGSMAGKNLSGVVGLNKDRAPIYPLYAKVKLSGRTDPRTTVLYKYIGYTKDSKDKIVPVYQLINKKGLRLRGNHLIEINRQKSIVPYNNIVPKGMKIVPTEKVVTYVTDVMPSKNSLRVTSDMIDQYVTTGVIDKSSDVQGNADINNNTNTSNDPANFNNLQESKAVIVSDKTILSNGELNKLKPFTGDSPRIAVASEYTDPAFFSKKIIDILDGKSSVNSKFGGPFSGSDFNALYIITKHDGLPIESLIKYKIPKIIHFSITGLGGTKYEPGVMKPNDFLDRIQKMLEMGLDPESVTVRIDPIIPGVTPKSAIENIIKRSSEMGIKNIRFSIMDQYSTTKQFMEELGYDYTKYYETNSLHARQSTIDGISKFMETFSDKYGVKLSTCAEPLTNSSISKEACLSVNAVNKMLGTSISESGGTGKRKLCSCFGGKTDLLRYSDNCASSCAYCYAHHNNDKILQYYNEDGTLKDMPLTKLSETETKEPTLDFKETDNETKDEFLKFAEEMQVKINDEELKKAKEESKVVEELVYTFSDGFKVNLPFKLNDQQITALKELERFVNSNGRVVTLSGYAGTGKTTIVGIFYEWLKRRYHGDILFSAPTHRANAVTRQKTPGAKVKTLQSILGIAPNFDISVKKFDLNQMKYAISAAPKIEQNGILFVDEASMIQDSLYDYMMQIAAQKNLSIIFIGDKGQLRPPTAEDISKVFTALEAPQLSLTKVERTGDNPILKESTRVRNGEGFSYNTEVTDKGVGVTFTNDPVDANKFIQDSVAEMFDTGNWTHFKVLSATNNSFPAYNQFIRNLRYGKLAPQIEVGELLMAYDNKIWDSIKERYGIVNSVDYTVKSVKPTTMKVKLKDPTHEKQNMLITLEGYDVTLQDVMDPMVNPITIGVVSNFEASEKLLIIQDHIDYLYSKIKELKANRQFSMIRTITDEISEITQNTITMKDVKDGLGNLKVKKTLDYGYAHTIHKSQGGTYDKVLILDDTIENFKDETNDKKLRQELKYVAVSRATTSVMVLKQNQSKSSEVIFEISDEVLEDELATSEDVNNAAREDARDKFKDQNDEIDNCKI